MIERFTLGIFAQNSPGILHRIASIFTRRKVNIESLSVSESERPGISRFTIVINGERAAVEKMAAQLRRIIEVVSVCVATDEEIFFEEIALYRVAKGNEAELAGLLESAGAKIVGSDAHSLLIQHTGAEEEICRLQRALVRFDLREFVRSGRIAMRLRGGQVVSSCDVRALASNQVTVHG